MANRFAITASITGKREGETLALDGAVSIKNTMRSAVPFSYVTIRASASAGGKALGEFVSEVGPSLDEIAPGKTLEVPLSGAVVFTPDDDVSDGFSLSATVRVDVPGDERMDSEGGVLNASLPVSGGTATLT